ncbi:MAG: type II toxin-antitoxin system VapC family toxin [Planctomycetes bacterium]|nr:type II toxin-antitoxin system VapC family toxin [Planctomycetota bacterium]
MPYLLDTNIWIHYLKQPDSRIHAKLATLDPTEVVTCSIVRCELLHGAEKYGDRNRRVATVNQTLAPFNSVSFDDVDAEVYAKIRHELEKSGNVIGPYDLQIAAICVRHQFTLVTGNLDEFSRVQDLMFEDWVTDVSSSS